MVQLAQNLLLELDVLDLLEVDDVGLGYLLEGQDLLVGADHLLHSPESTSSQGLSDLVLGDVVGVALKGVALGLGNAVRVMAERRPDLFLLPFLLELFELVGEEVELFGVHIQIS